MLYRALRQHRAGRRCGLSRNRGGFGAEYSEEVDTVQRRRYRVAYDSISRLCGQGLPGDDLFARVSGQLSKAVTFRTAGWLRLDPKTLLPMPGLLLQADHDRVSRIIHNEYFEPDVVKFRELARARVPAQSL